MDHLSDELLRLDVVLEIEMQRMREAPQDPSLETFRGMFMTASEAKALLDEGLPFLKLDTEQESLLLHLEEAIANRLDVAAAHGCEMPLLRLRTLLGLSDLDVRMLVVAAAPHMNRKYLKLYAYLQDDMTCQYVTMDLMLRLCCRSEEERRLALERLAGTSGELRMFWSRPQHASASTAASILSSPIRLDDRMLAYILGLDWRFDGALSHMTMRSGSDALPPLLTGGDLHKRLLGQAEQAMSSGAPHVWMLHGPAGSGKSFHARHLGAALGLSLLEWDVSHAPGDERAFVESVDRVLLEARLHRALPAFDCIGALQEQTREAGADKRLEWLVKRLSEHDGIAFLFGEVSCKPAQLPPSISWRSIALTVPDMGERRRLWQSFAGEAAALTETESDRLAAKFRFTPGSMRAAVLELQHGEWASGSYADGPERTAAQKLHQAAYRLIGQRLKDQAVKMEPRFGWDDLVLPPDTIQLLKQACGRLQHQHTVMVRWGFERKLAYGKGTSMLFTGPPGTGKTMSAMVMAREMDAELYRVDLSRVVSKYIGETEKNLSDIFDQARLSGAILFFDEADALFGKRSEVKDAHDKYANMETSFLLQKMEEYDGLTVLASNFAQNLDEAFTRRIQYIVKFPFPDAVQREQLWRSAIPAELPVESIDYAYLAQTFDLAGGPIKNIVLTASFIAAEEGVAVSMKQLVEGGIQEYKKIGKLLPKERLGAYATYGKG